MHLQGLYICFAFKKQIKRFARVIAYLRSWKKKYQTQVEEMGKWRGLYSYFFKFPLNQKLSSLQICRKEGCDGDSFSYLRELGPQHAPMWAFPSGSDGKESACNARDPSLIPGVRRSPEGGNGCPLQYSCMENSMVRGACWATAHGVTKSQTGLSNYQGKA